MASFERWRGKMATLPHTELAEIVLDESAYTENVAEGPLRRRPPAAFAKSERLVRSMQDSKTLGGFLRAHLGW